VRVIPVIDLLGGRAVHARAGRRDLYQPLQTVAGTTIGSGDAVALARIYVDRLGADELYVADLEALAGRSPQDALVESIAGLGARLLLDAGVTSVDSARRARAAGGDRVVVALETLDDYQSLREICDALGGNGATFSLDLRDGEPVISRAGRVPAGGPPEVVAARAVDAGARTVLVIDLARVGTGRGLDLALLARVRDAIDDRVRLVAGGGVRDSGDLTRLADVGCDAALVASALHDGRIGREDIAAIERYRSVSR
jgi:phosphoribosylformimino-5-aminoimidazole carboxamide ribotide isomerase